MTDKDQGRGAVQDTATLDDGTVLDERANSGDDALLSALREYEEAVSDQVEDGPEPEAEDDAESYQLLQDLQRRSLTPDEIADVEGRIATVEHNERQRAENEALAEAVQAVGEAIQRPDIPEDILRKMVLGHAVGDERIKEAFEARKSDPGVWNQALRRMAREMGKQIGPPIDQNATEDRAAVAAAVRSASNKAPDPDDEVPDFKGKSDQDFYDWLAKQ